MDKASKKLRTRTVWLLIIMLVLGFGAAITRLAYLQLVKGEELRSKAVEQQLSDTTLDAKRGTIYDKNKKILAQSASVWQVIMAPIYFEDDKQRAYVAKELASILELDEKELLEDTKEQTYYVNVKRKVESAEKDKLVELQEYIKKEWGLVNVITLIDDYTRYYPYNDLASTVIGFVGDDGQGLSGLEYQYQQYLAGTPGRVVASQISNISDDTNMPFEANQNIAAIDGNSLVLTIDETVQSIVEKYMKQNIETHKVYNRGVGIVMDVHTGEILAMATVEGCDLNKPFELSKKDADRINKINKEYLVKHEIIKEEDNLTNKQLEELIKKTKAEEESSSISTKWRNKAVSDTYYPGSVFKMITLSMALQERAVNKNTRVFCDGAIQVFDKNITCTDDHGTQTYRDALENSCNPGFVQIGQALGAAKFWDYYQGFGFSDKTGIDLPGESEDIFFSDDGHMEPVDLAVSSFGQGVSITPIQMITACSAIANGGHIVQPHIVKQILDSEGNVVKTFGTEYKRQIITEDVAQEVTDILEENASDGSGTSGYVAGYRVAGKTGTSQKLTDANFDGEEDYIASYCGFAPAEDPKVACLVFFDTPTTGSYYGAAVSGPVFANIMSEVLPYLEVDAKYSDDETPASNTVAGAYTGILAAEATRAAQRDGFQVSVMGEGKVVIAQSPTTGSSLTTGGLIFLYTDNESLQERVTVPSLIGFGVDDCIYVAQAYDLNVSITGAYAGGGVCHVQSIKPGQQVAPGTVVTVTFSTQPLVVANNDQNNQDDDTDTDSDDQDEQSWEDDNQENEWEDYNDWQDYNWDDYQYYDYYQGGEEEQWE